MIRFRLLSAVPADPHGRVSCPLPSMLGPAVQELSGCLAQKDNLLPTELLVSGGQEWSGKELRCCAARRQQG